MRGLKVWLLLAAAAMSASDVSANQLQAMSYPSMDQLSVKLSSEQPDEDNRKQGDKQRGIYIRGGVNSIKYDVNLGSELQTTPIHPDDGGPSRGSATTDIKGGWGSSLSVGVEGLIGSGRLRFAGGIDGRYNYLFTDSKDSMYDTALQPLPWPYESYAFTELKIGGLTYMPFAGVKIDLNEDSTLGIQVGFPNTQFDYRSGHYRYSALETVRKDSWKGFGTNVELNFEGQFSDRMGLLITLGREEYRPEFLGQKTKIGDWAFGFYLMVKIK